MKYQLQKIAQDYLYDGVFGLPNNRAANKSLYFCNHFNKPKSAVAVDTAAVHLLVSVEDETVTRASYGNVEHCHNSLVCPVCARARSLKDKERLNKIISAAEQQGYECIPTTSTVYHSSKDTLPALLERLKKQQREFLGNGKRFSRFKERYGIFGSIQVIELTLSIKDYKVYNMLWSRYILSPEFPELLAGARAEYLNFIERYYQLSLASMENGYYTDSLLAIDSDFPAVVSELRRFRNRYMVSPEEKTFNSFQRAYDKAVARVDVAAYDILKDRFAYNHFKQFVDYHPHYHTIWICKKGSYAVWKENEAALKTAYFEKAVELLTAANIPVASLEDISGEPILDDSGDIIAYENKFGRWLPTEKPVIPKGVVNPQILYDRGFVICAPVHDSSYVTKSAWGAAEEMTAKDDKPTHAFWKMTPFGMLRRRVGKKPSALFRAVWNDIVVSLKHRRRLVLSRKLEQSLSIEKDEDGEDTATTNTETQIAAIIPSETFHALRQKFLLDNLVTLSKGLPLYRVFPVLYEYVSEVLPTAPPLMLPEYIHYTPLEQPPDGWEGDMEMARLEQQDIFVSN